MGRRGALTPDTSAVRLHVGSRSFNTKVALLLLLPVGLLIVFYALPTLNLITSATSSSSMVEHLTSRSTWNVLWFTIWQATLSTLVTFAVALPITWAVSVFRFRGRFLAQSVLVTPFVMPSIVVAAAVRTIIPGNDDTGLTPIVIAHCIFNVAVVVRIVGSRWNLIPRDLVHAARSLGAGPRRTFTSVTLPLLRRSLAAASALVFAFTFMSYGVVAILGGPAYRTIEVEIFTQAVTFGDIDQAVVLSLLQVVVVGLLFTLTAGENPVSQRMAVAHGVPLTLHPRRRTIGLFIAISTALMCTPFLLLLRRSFGGEGTFTTAGWRALWDGSLSSIGIDIPRAALNTIVFAVGCVIVAVPCAVIIATARQRAVLGTRQVELLTAGPVITSGVILGFGALITFDISPMNWRSSTWLIPVMHAVVALPIATRIIVQSLLEIPEGQREAAATLGAGPFRTWRTIDIGASRHALQAAVGVSAALSIGEFGATSFLSRQESQTLPVVLAQVLGRPGDIVQAAGFALSLVMALFVAVVVARA
ncbi:MAG: hypothetical protein RL419_1672 [Actinomycetota bacterium]